MQTPTLGELALQARLIRGNELDEALRYQRQAYLEGDFRRLGELLVSYGRLSRPAVRRLLLRQGITIVECTLCRTRYNALLFRGLGECLRCGRRLQPSQPHASLTVEDVISGGGPQADQLLHQIRQRNPRLGHYEILGEVGRGGMGVIYKAHEPRLRRTVALKFMKAGEEVDPEDKERFRREARAVANLKHPHIVQALAIEEARGLTYMAMDFVPGVAMDNLTNEGALTEREIVDVVAKISRGLHYAHEQGLIHRDVKPANIVITRKLEPFLVDFGVAKQLKDKTTMSLTSEGEVLGSLAYMAPEYVARGKPALDRRCDVYGLGVVLYETLTQGLLPYGDPDDEEMIMRLVKEPPIPIETALPSVNPELAKIVNRAISKDPERRHATAKALGEDLQAYLETGSGVRAPEPPPQQKDVFLRTSMEFIAPVDLDDEPSAPAAVPGAAPSASSRLWMVAALVFLLMNVLFAAAWAASARKASFELRDLRRQTGRSELRAARLYQSVGDLDGAEQALTSAIELLPDDALPLEERAALRERRKDAAGAVADRAAAKAIRERQGGK
ncbi:MAG: serine/threonine protein kinase [Planctomycetota bacterium]